MWRTRLDIIAISNKKNSRMHLGYSDANLWYSYNIKIAADAARLKGW